MQSNTAIRVQLNVSISQISFVRRHGPIPSVILLSKRGIFIRKLRNRYSDSGLRKFEFLDDSSIFNKIGEKIILLCTISPDFREGGSEQIREGAQIPSRPPTDRVERFLSMLRFDSGGEVNDLAKL